MSVTEKIIVETPDERTVEVWDGDTLLHTYTQALNLPDPPVPVEDIAQALASLPADTLADLRAALGL